MSAGMPASGQRVSAGIEVVSEAERIEQEAARVLQMAQTLVIALLGPMPTETGAKAPAEGDLAGLGPMLRVRMGRTHGHLVEAQRLLEQLMEEFAGCLPGGRETAAQVGGLVPTGTNPVPGVAAVTYR